MARISEADLARIRARGHVRIRGDDPAPKRPKYGNKKAEADGHVFDSEKERRRYHEICLQLRAGAISDLQMQVVFVLVPSVRLDGKMKPAVRYVADFVYMQQGAQVVEDVKSEATRKLPVYRLKKHLMKHVHDIEVREV